MDEEFGSRVNRFEILDRLRVRILLVTCADRALIDHPKDQTEQVPAKKFYQWEEYVDE